MVVNSEYPGRMLHGRIQRGPVGPDPPAVTSQIPIGFLNT